MTRPRASGSRQGARRNSMKLLLRFLGFLFAAGTIVFLVGVARRRRPAVALSPRTCRIIRSSGLRAAGDDARARRRRLAARRIRQGAPALSADPGGAEARQQRLHRRRGQEFLRASAASTYPASRRAAMLYVAELRQRPPSAGRLDDHPAGGEELPVDQRGDVRRARSRKRCSRCKIERAYSKDKILELYLNEIYLGFGAYGVAAASLLYFDKSVHELTIAEAAYLAGAAQGPEQLQSVPPPRRGGRAAQLRHRSHGRGRLHLRRRRRQGEEGAARTSPCGRPTRTNMRPNISPRRCAAIWSTTTARRSCTRAACRCAPRSIPSCSCVARKAMVNGLVSFDETQGLSRPNHQDRRSAATGASNSPT